MNAKNNLDKLAIRYAELGDEESASNLIKEVTPIVYKIAHIVMEKNVSGKPVIDEDDLASAGFRLVLKLAKKYGPQEAKSFRTWINAPVKKEMYSEIRKGRNCGVTAYSMRSELEKAQTSFYVKNGRYATTEEALDLIGVEDKRRPEWRFQSYCGDWISLDSYLGGGKRTAGLVDEKSNAPFHKAMTSELANWTLSLVSPGERRILWAVCAMGMTETEAAKHPLIQRSQSGVSQIKTNSLKKLRAMLRVAN